MAKIEICFVANILKQMGVYTCTDARKFLENTGERVIVTDDVIKKAVMVDAPRPQTIINFCRVWLSWSPELCESMTRRVEKILYPKDKRNRFFYMPFLKRSLCAKRVVLAAILAYRKEMAKP